MQDNKYLLTINDIAALLGVSRSTVLRRRGKPGFPAHRPKGDSEHPRWRANDIYRWLEDNPGYKKNRR